MNKQRHIWKDEHGSIALEAALLFPIVLLLMVMAADMMSYFNAIRKLSASAATAADLLATTSGTVTGSELTGIANLAAPSGVTVAMPDGVGTTFQVYEVVYGRAVPRWEFSSGSGLYCGSPKMDLGSLMSDDSDVLVVGACGEWDAHTKKAMFGMDGPLNIVQFSIVRPRQSLHTLCTDCS